MRRALCGLALLAVCCAGDPSTPGETVLLYARSLASDPLRTLELLTPAFHRAHGLRFHEVADRPFDPPDASEMAVGDADLELERARLGWLTVLTKRVFAIHGPRFTRRVRGEVIDGDRARVVLESRSAGLRFDATFRLVRRSPADPWQIDSITLPELSRGMLMPGYLLAPNAELHRKIVAARQQATH